MPEFTKTKTKLHCNMVLKLDSMSTNGFIKRDRSYIRIKPMPPSKLRRNPPSKL